MGARRRPPRPPTSRGPSTRRPTPSAPTGPTSTARGQFRFDPEDEGRKAGWYEARRAGLRPARSSSPSPGRASSRASTSPKTHGRRLVSPDVRGPRRLPQGRPRLAPVRRRRLAGRRLGQRQARRRARGRLHPVRGRRHRRPQAAGKPAVVVVRVFDPTDPELPTGKQVGWYTPTSGIWQTVWLEVAAEGDASPAFTITDRARPGHGRRSTSRLAGRRPAGSTRVSVEVRRPDASSRVDDCSSTARVDRADRARRRSRSTSRTPKLWTPETPHLYDVDAGAEGARRRRSTRSRPTSASARSPGASTATPPTSASCSTASRSTSARRSTSRSTRRGSTPRPTTTSSSDDLEIAKSMGLNGLRIHIKPDEPRRLYWADKLGLLILEDMPNTWRQNAKAAHGLGGDDARGRRPRPEPPGIVAWVAFNETWGLGDAARYKQDKDTQDWVGRMVAEIRKLDPTRLVEDNSPCNYDHVENTDLNSWHFYIDDHAEAAKHIADVVAKTEPGSAFNYCPGREAGDGPADQLGVRRRLGRQRRPRRLVGLPRPDHPAPPAAEDPGIRLHRAVRHRVGAQRLRRLRPLPQGLRLRRVRPRHDARPTCKGPTSSATTRPRRSSPSRARRSPSRSSSATTPTARVGPSSRWWVDGLGRRGRAVGVGPPETRPVELDRVRRQGARADPVQRPRPAVRRGAGPDAPRRRTASGSRPTSSTWSSGRRSRPPRVERDGRPRGASSGSPRAISPAARGRAARRASAGQGVRAGQGVLRVSAQGARGGRRRRRPESIDLRLEVAVEGGPREGRLARADRTRRTTRRPTRGSGRRPSSLDQRQGRRPRRPRATTRPTPAACSRTWRRFEHGSYGELVEVAGRPARRRSRPTSPTGKPLVIRLAVPDDAEHAGGLCVFGAETGPIPVRPDRHRSTPRTRFPADLGVKSDEPGRDRRRRSPDDRRSRAGDADSGQARRRGPTRPPTRGGWTGPDFDDAGWTRGKAGFGTGDTPGLERQHPLGHRPNLAPDRRRRPQARPRRRPDAPPLPRRGRRGLRQRQAALPGRRATSPTTRTSRWTTPRRPSSGAGSNVVAVSCRQTGGGQGIDVGLKVMRDE